MTLTERLHDELFTTAPQAYQCCMCGDLYSEHSFLWREPHEAFKSTGLVCSEECAEHWCEEYFDEIEEYELKQVQGQ